VAAVLRSVLLSIVLSMRPPRRPCQCETPHRAGMRGILLPQQRPGRGRLPGGRSRASPGTGPPHPRPRILSALLQTAAHRRARLNDMLVGLSQNARSSPDPRPHGAPHLGRDRRAQAPVPSRTNGRQRASPERGPIAGRRRHRGQLQRCPLGGCGERLFAVPFDALWESSCPIGIP